MTQYALIMLAAGVGIPVLAALNAALGRLIGSPTTAGVVLFLIAFLASGALMLAFSGPQALGRLAEAPRHLFLAGLLVADTGLSALIATHNHDLAARMDRVVHLDTGRITPAA